MSATQQEVTKDQAEEIYKKYVQLLHDLIFVNNNHFDLVIGPADSGVLMAKTVERLYKIKNTKESPKVLILPIQRYENSCADTGAPFDNLSNISLIGYLKSELSSLNEITSVLFVDDEISSEALTAKSVLKLLLKVEDNIKPNNLVYTIIAENHGFQWKYNIPSSDDFPPLPIRYYAYGNKLRWQDESDPKIQYHANGTVFPILSDDIFKKYKGKYRLPCENKEFSKKHLAALFTDGQIKDTKNGLPYLANDLLMEVKNEIDSFEDDREQFLDSMDNLIKQAVT